MLQTVSNTNNPLFSYLTYPYLVTETVISVQSETDVISESTGEWFVMLTVTENPPEKRFVLVLEADGRGSYSAIAGMLW